MQLTYPPMKAIFPSISPDGTRIAFTTYNRETFIVNMNGGPPQRIVEKNSIIANFSPDGNSLVVTSWTEGLLAREKELVLFADYRRTHREGISYSFLPRLDQRGLGHTGHVRGRNRSL